jgi:hypothetical protein
MFVGFDSKLEPKAPATGRKESNAAAERPAARAVGSGEQSIGVLKQSFVSKGVREMASESGTNVYEQVLDNMRKAAESGLKMQQDAFQQWNALWPGLPALPSAQGVWMDKVLEFQRQWSNTVSDLAHKHRSTMDRQYQAALESLDEALRVGESSTPEEYRKRTDQFCRKSLECMRETFEAQMKEHQEAMQKWGELVTKVGS